MMVTPEHDLVISLVNTEKGTSAEPAAAAKYVSKIFWYPDVI